MAADPPLGTYPDDQPQLVIRERTPAERRAYWQGARAALSMMQERHHRHTRRKGECPRFRAALKLIAKDLQEIGMLMVEVDDAR